jgi:hypothetical protein
MATKAPVKPKSTKRAAPAAKKTARGTGSQPKKGSVPPGLAAYQKAQGKM